MTQEYRERLWVLTPPQDDSEACLIRSFSGEAALFEETESGRSDRVFKIKLPLTRLVGSSDSKTRWTQDRVPVTEAIEAGSKLRQMLPREMWSDVEFSADPKPLRLKIYSPQPRITDLPWEWLTDNAGNPIALRPDVRLMRCVPSRFEIPRLTIPQPVKVLVILTNPKDERLLDGYTELQTATQSLTPPRYQVQVCSEPTVEDFKQSLHDFLPHIVHYIGHAGINNGEGNIILHDSNNRTYWMSGALLSRILPSTVRLICLSTCVTSQNYQILGLPHLAHASNDLNLPTMVTNRYPISQQSASIFWNTFYNDLIDQHGDVNEAFHRAQVQVWQAESAFSDWASFSLVLRDRTGRALKIVKEAGHEIERIQASELQAQYAARLANDLAEHISVYGDYTTAGIREKYEVASKEANDLLKAAEDSSKDY